MERIQLAIISALDKKPTASKLRGFIDVHPDIIVKLPRSLANRRACMVTLLLQTLYSIRR
jgi:hypothetical protein